MIINPSKVKSTARLTLMRADAGAGAAAAPPISLCSTWALSTFEDGWRPRDRTFFYVDLAANHPTRQSSTYELDQRGWRGLCIEANPRYLALLRSQRTCAVVEAAIDEVERSVTFNFGDSDASGETGGIVDHRFDNRQSVRPVMHVQLRAPGRVQPSNGHPAPHGTANVRKLDVSAGTTTGQADNSMRTLRTRTLGSVLIEATAPRVIHYLSLDVEGAESAVLSASFPWDSWTFLTLTIERPPPELNSRLFAHGYLFVRIIGLTDTAYVHRSHPFAHRYLASNRSFEQMPAKCRSHSHVYTERRRLARNATVCMSRFGCCEFPGHPQATTPYVKDGRFRSLDDRRGLPGRR